MHGFRLNWSSLIVGLLFFFIVELLDIYWGGGIRHKLMQSEDIHGPKYRASDVIIYIHVSIKTSKYQS